MRNQSDAEIAASLYKDQLRTIANIFADRRHCQTIGGTADSRPASPVQSATPQFDVVYSQLSSKSRNSSERYQTQPHHFNPESSGISSIGQRDVLVACVSCDDEKINEDLLIAPCGDRYCSECINTLYEHASTDESLFPPRCCRMPIPMEDAVKFLNVEVYNRFQEIQEEFSTSDRIYCHKTDCAKFISPNLTDGDRAKCGQCNAVTCIICKTAAHEGDCPEDPAVQSMMTASAQAGFRQCYQCRRMIELHVGCFHITWV